MKKMNKKWKVIIAIALIMGTTVCVLYYNLTPSDKWTIKRSVEKHFKRIKTMRTVADFKDVYLGMPFRDFIIKYGEWDGIFGGFGSPEYYLAGGDSIIVYFDNDRIYLIQYADARYEISEENYRRMICLLDDKHRSILLDGKRKKITKEVLPLSGDEPDYEPKKWEINDENGNARVLISAPSYGYALNMMYDPRTGKRFQLDEHCECLFVPGSFAGIKLKNDYSNIIECCIADARKMGYIFRSINEKDRPSKENYKVALFIPKEGPFSANEDIWLRQDHDGYWSYKNGFVFNLDDDNDVIYNPTEANLGSNTRFMGFFEVGGTSRIRINR